MNSTSQSLPAPSFPDPSHLGRGAAALNPAFSVVLFTTLAGTGQGLVTALAVATLAGASMSRGIMAIGLAGSLVLLLVALAASFRHPGRLGRAWWAVPMWRTSWLAREVIVLSAFVALVAAWLALRVVDGHGPWRELVLPVTLVAASLVLWYCTAMIYACLRFIQEWAHPLTLANYTLSGLASGLALFALLTRLGGPPELVRPAVTWALALTVIAGVVRIVSILRNARLQPASARELTHGRELAFLARIRYFAIGAGFVVPALLMLPVLAGGDESNGGWLLTAALVQLAGVLAERWYFFAQARHPQNPYHQIVS